MSKHIFISFSFGPPLKAMNQNHSFFFLLYTLVCCLLSREIKTYNKCYFIILRTLEMVLASRKTYTCSNITLFYLLAQCYIAGLGLVCPLMINPPFFPSPQHLTISLYDSLKHLLSYSWLISCTSLSG